MSNIAILGHPTRGREVIQLLEMLGGIDYFNLTGAETDGFYYIYHGNNKIYHCLDINTENVIIFTLEEFEENFPYKVGDKVYNIIHNENQTITEVVWDFQEDEIVYQTNNNDYLFVHYLQPYKEENMEENMEENRDNPKAPILSNRYDYAEGKCGYVIPDGYEFDYIKEGFQTEIILKPKKPQYPKTYEECCEVLMGKTDFQDFELVLTKLSTNINEENSISPEPPYINSINNLYKLLICRDAYWKIAGEEMGLDKPWKPDWEASQYWDDEYETYYTISYDGVNIKCYNDEDLYERLAFPTAEMRDAFYENFKDLIEQCKELL